MAYEVKALTGKSYSMKEYEKFLSQPFNNNFGVSKEKIADLVLTTWAKADYYNLTKDKIINDLIPILEKELGGYTMFFIVTVVEGGGQANYLNHYVVGSPEGSDDYIQALKNDVAYVKSVWNKDIPRDEQVAMGAPETSDGYNEELEDDPGASYRMYDKVPKKSIGSYYMPSTLAGNAWIFASEYLESIDAYYGNAYDQSIDLLKQLGVSDPFNDKGGNDGGNDDKDDNDEDNNSDDDDDGWFGDIDWGELFPDDPVGAVKKAVTGLMDKIEEYTQWDMHSIGSDKHFANRYFYIIKTYNNTYKLRLNTTFFDDIKDFLGGIGDDADGSEDDDNDDNDDGEDDDDDKDDGNDNNKQFNTCYLHPERNFMQGFYPTIEDAQANNYPANSPHMGYDMRMTSETLKAIGDGTVYTSTQIDASGFGWGNYIVLYPNDYDYAFLFAHLDTVDISNGQKVKKGDKLGITGQTGVDQMGIPDNRHLHIEQITNPNENEGANPSGQRINPRDFIVKYCSKVNDKEFKKDSSIYHS